MPEETKRPKIRSIVVDTLTAIQTDEWMRSISKPGHDEWMDMGKDIYNFVANLKSKGFECLYILGEPGTGKSSGMRTLAPGTNIWYNADKKNPVWAGGKEQYGKKTAPIAPYHIIPSSYSDIISHLNALPKEAFHEDRYAFLLGHLEQFKSGVQTMERLKTLGKVATKMQLEGGAETVLYSRVKMESGKPTYILETQNNGYNTARSPQGLFEGTIPNDYNLVIEKLLQF